MSQQGPSKNDGDTKSEATEQAGASQKDGEGNTKVLEAIKMETSENVNIKQEPETRNRAPALPMEDEPEYDDTLCILDWCKYQFLYLRSCLLTN